MRRMSNRNFISWLAKAGIADESGGGAVWLTFTATPDLRRSWDAPRDPALHGDWLRRVVRAASPDGPWWLWRRDGAAWWTDGEPPRGSSEALRRASREAGVPYEFAGALGFGGDERDVMTALVEAVAGGWREWDVWEDVYLVPGDRSCAVMLCHDEEIHAAFATPERMDAFAAATAG